MNDENRDAALRQMARHRGLKLVRSRRRKPGVGDYGHYGLTDANGARLLGFDDDGLTASAEEIEAYLRKGQNATWQSSVAATPARPRPKPKTEAPPQTAGPPPAHRSARPAPAKSSRPSPPPEKPRPALIVREATAGDAAAIADLVARMGRAGPDRRATADRIAMLAKIGGGALVADREGILGIVAWAVMPTLQHGPIGRITLILVAERERRAGLGRMLLDAAVAELTKAGCAAIEAMSDIEMRNAHGFFRALGFTQTSYRFARPVG